MGPIALAPNMNNARAQATGTVAYLCLEYAIEDNLPIYAGGLGVLAGDLVLEAGSLGLDFVAIGLFYSHGFSESTEINPTTGGFSLEPFTIPVEVGDQEIAIKIWSKKYGTARLYLLDGGEITKNLYGPDQATMFKQQIILGVGGIRLLNKLNITSQIYHLNEGHTAMALLELARDNNWDYQTVGKTIAATKHTVFSGAGLHLTLDQLKSGLALYATKYNLDIDNLFSLGTHDDQPGIFATAKFLLRFAARQSAVSHLHADMEKKVHPGSMLVPITNGVHAARWDQFSTRQKNSILTVVWARRFTSYKRPELLFSDMDRLSRLVNEPQPIQLIIAGKTNLTDTAGQELVKRLKNSLVTANLDQKVVFLENYDLALAKKLVATADVWLNTPIPGQEACGTSGMKAGLNGALMLSTNDGWVPEVNWEGIGWILPEENISTALYDVLEKEIAPLFYDHPDVWLARSQKTREIILQNFTAARMLTDYQRKLYSA